MGNVNTVFNVISAQLASSSHLLLITAFVLLFTFVLYFMVTGLESWAVNVVAVLRKQCEYVMGV